MRRDSAIWFYAGMAVGWIGCLLAMWWVGLIATPKDQAQIMPTEDRAALPERKFTAGEGLSDIDCTSAAFRETNYCAVPPYDPLSSIRVPILIGEAPPLPVMPRLEIDITNLLKIECPSKTFRESGWGTWECVK